MAAFGKGNHTCFGWIWLWIACWAALIAGCSPVTSTPRPLLTQPLKTDLASQMRPAIPTSRANQTNQASPARMMPFLTPTGPFPPPVPTPRTAHLPTMTQLSREGVPATVSVEVLDVWDEPAHEKDYWSRQTQLILGERVLILAEVGDWASIVAVEQPSHKDPRGYPGWVRRGSLVNGWSQADKVAVVMVLFTQRLFGLFRIFVSSLPCLWYYPAARRR